MQNRSKVFAVIILTCLVSVPVSSFSVPLSTDSGVSLNPHFPTVPLSYNSVSVKYSVTFVQSGLPKGTSWSVSLDGADESTNTSSIVFNRTNGTYNFTVGGAPGYTPAPDHGSVNINGTNERVSITFGAKEYDITFREEGLPAGMLWNVSLNGTMESSVTNETIFLKPNGTYYYVVGLISNYTLSPFAGLFTVSGKPITTLIIFSRLYQVLFHETGLPKETRWSVAFNGVTKITTTNNVSLKEINGTYPYTINMPENFTTYPTTGTIIVNGSSVFQTVKFVLYTITFTGLLSPETASMFIDGQEVRTVAGVFTLSLAAGQEYEVEVKSPGYRNYFYNLTVTSRTNPTVLLNINLVSTEPVQGFPIASLIYAVVILASIIAVFVITIRFQRRPKKKM